jgi:hypothetical protein
MHVSANACMHPPSNRQSVRGQQLLQTKREFTASRHVCLKARKEGCKQFFSLCSWHVQYACKYTNMFICMYDVYMYMHACMHNIHEYIHAWTHKHIHIYAHAGMKIYVHRNIHACIHNIHAYIHAHMYACICACIHTYICMCIRVHAHACMHVHTNA